MSIQAMTWVIEGAPDVPPHLCMTLMGLANHAGPDGCGAYPSEERLAYYSRKSVRAVHNDIKALLRLNLIKVGDQRFVQHIRPGHRPTVFDLNIGKLRAPYKSAAEMAREQHETSDDGPVDNWRMRPEADFHPPRSREEVQYRETGSVVPGDRKPTSDEPSFDPLEEPNPLLSTDFDEFGLVDGRAKDGGLDLTQKAQHRDTATAIVAQLPTRLPNLPAINNQGRDSLIRDITNALGRNVTTSQIAEAVTSNLPADVRNAGRILASRVRDLEPIQAKPHRNQVPECGRCENRWVPVVDDEGRERWAPCPTCSPQALAKAAV